MQSFSNISQKDCQKICNAIVENAEQKWKSGVRLANSKDYGTATSLLIVSVEEFIKGLILFLDSKGFQFRKVAGMNAFFRNHQLRYVLAYVMFGVAILGDDLVRFLKMLKTDGETSIKFLEQLRNDEVFREEKLKTYALKKYLQLAQELHWFSKADIFRQDGFYSDYKEGFRSPLKIDESTYFEVFERMNKVKNVCKVIIREYDSGKNADGHLDKMKKDFKSKNYYDQIAVALTKVKKEKNNPFILLMSKIQEFKFEGME